jgi:hypothetical protein
MIKRKPYRTAKTFLNEFCVSINTAVSDALDFAIELSGKFFIHDIGFCHVTKLAYFTCFIAAFTDGHQFRFMMGNSPLLSEDASFWAQSCSSGD